MERGACSTGITLKDSVYALKDQASGEYIAFADESKAPRLAPLHLATLAPTTPACLDELEQLASRRLQGVPYELERVDAL
jgi:hypothetical protein